MASGRQDRPRHFGHWRAGVGTYAARSSRSSDLVLAIQPKSDWSRSSRRRQAGLGTTDHPNPTLSPNMDLAVQPQPYWPRSTSDRQTGLRPRANLFALHQSPADLV